MYFRVFFCGFLWLTIGNANAQPGKNFVKPDYKNIEQITRDKKSANWYPKLFSRYSNNDTNLTDHDFQLLYYGYFFQPGFCKLGVVSKFDDSLKALNDKDELTDNEKKNMLRYTKEELKKDPFDLDNLNRLCNIYQLMGNDDSVNLTLYKIKMIARTLFNTGDGHSEDAAIHVLSVKDEYSILYIMGYEFDGNKTVTPNHCDYLKVKRNEDNINGFYFDTKELVTMYDKQFKRK